MTSQSSQDESPPPSSLQRTASILARQLAMAKLTGSSLPPVPLTSLLDPLPTLDQLQATAIEQRNYASVQHGDRPAGLRRENTVAVTGTTTTGPNIDDDDEESRSPPLAGSSNAAAGPLRRNNTVSGTTAPLTTAASSEPTPTDRQTVRANLIRKLSARRGLGKPSAPSSSADRVGQEPIPPPPPAPRTVLAPPIPSLVSDVPIAHHASSSTTTAAASDSNAIAHLGGESAVPQSANPVSDYYPHPSLSPPPNRPLVEGQTIGTGGEGDDTNQDPSHVPPPPPRQQQQQPQHLSSESGLGLRSGSIATTASSTCSSISTSDSSSSGPNPPRLPLTTTMGNPRTRRPLPTFGIAAVEGSGAYHDHEHEPEAGFGSRSTGTGADDDDDDDDVEFEGGGRKKTKQRERGSSASSSVFGLAAAAGRAAAGGGGGGGRIRGSDAGSVMSFPPPLGIAETGTDSAATAASSSASSPSPPPPRRTSRFGSIGLGVFTKLAPDDNNDTDTGVLHSIGDSYGWTTMTDPNRRRASVVSQTGSSTSTLSSSSVSSLPRRRRRGDRRSGASGTAEESIGEEDEEEGDVDPDERIRFQDGRSPTLDQTGAAADAAGVDGDGANRDRSPFGGTKQTEEEEVTYPYPPPFGIPAGSAGGTPVERTPRLGAATAFEGSGKRSPKPEARVQADNASEMPKPAALDRGGSPAMRGWSPQQQRYFQQVSTATDGTVEKRPFAFNLALADYRPVAGSGPFPLEISPDQQHRSDSTPLQPLPSSSSAMVVPDAPISPTSVIPNPMEALAFPAPPQSQPQMLGARRSPRVTDSEHERERERSSPQSVAGSRSHRLEPTHHGSPSLRRSPAGATDSDCSFSSPDPRRSPMMTSRRDHASVGSLPSVTSSPALSSVSASSSPSSESSSELEPRVTRLPAAELPANRILAKLDSILGPADEIDATDAGGRPTTLLDDPPRKLLLHAPVLQVVNANTVKDRYLFLFDDLLVIAKPLIEDHLLTGEPVSPNLDSHFLVKSVVECKQLKLSGDEDSIDEAATSSSSGKKKHPLLVAFVDRFANDPSRAIASLIQKGGLANDGQTIANLLYRNTDLNRNQLGAYLADRRQKHVLRAYIERFRFAGVRIDDALRLFLMSVRLPYDPVAAEYVVDVLAGMWSDANPSTGIDAILAHELMMTIMRLSDALHGGDGPGERFFRDPKPDEPPTVDDFIASFRNADTRAVVPEDLLARIYTAVRRERVELASDNSIFSMTPDIEATIEPTKLPTQLTYRTPSARFTISIPAPDAKFTIKLQGADLQFEPPVLSFARSTTQSFRVTGMALGIRTMVLVKRGANAPRYQGLPLNKAFSIERGFMQHTFQLSFTNHLDLKRKYMFSCRDVESRSRWLRLLRERIAASSSAPAPPTSTQAAAKAVAVQVLRDALLAPEEPVLSGAAPSPRPNVLAPRFGRPVTPVVPRGRLGTPTRPTTSARSNSISRLYPVLYRYEAEASDKRPSPAIRSAGSEGNLLSPSGVSSRVQTTNNSPDPGNSETATAKAVHGAFVKSGDELVLTTEQNSLLPLVLSFLNAGLDAAPAPLSLNGSAFQLPRLDGTTVPTPSFV